MAETAQELTAVGVRQPRRLALRRVSLTWLGVVPFFAYVTVFLLIPSAYLAVDAFKTSDGAFTLANIKQIFDPQYEDAFITSIKLSIVTAIAGGIFGFFVAYAALQDSAPRWIRSALTTYSGVAANFAGVPLAFAFVATLGATGIVTVWLKGFGIDIYDRGFSLFTFTGLAFTYIYFQLPLMVLIIMPSLEGLRREWREAATNLGATPLQFWQHIGLPILLPSLLGAMVLLFGNAFSAYATPYALTSGQINLVPILIGSVMSGNVLSDPNFGDALAFGMIVVMSISVVIYTILQQRSSRWLR